MRLAGLDLVLRDASATALRRAAASDPVDDDTPALLASPGTPVVAAPWRSLAVERSVDGGSVAAAREHVLTWGVLRDVGIGVLADRDRVGIGATVVQRMPWVGPGVLAPCRVVDVVDEPGRVGFTYAALPGHPLAGAEAFVVEVVDARVQARVTSVSRPEAPAARLAVPLLRRFQQVAAGQYVRSLARAASGA